VSREIVGWWMLDLARATAGDKFMSLLHTCRNASKTIAAGLPKFSLAVTSVIITYLVALSATNLCIYHKVAVQWLQCNDV